jgi:hypothetical protein
MDFHKNGEDNDVQQINLDAPKEDLLPFSEKNSISHYDQGWLDGYTTGVLDGCSHETYEEGSLHVPSCEITTNNNPSNSIKKIVSEAVITSRIVKGIRGPWGNIIPSK